MKWDREAIEVQAALELITAQIKPLTSERVLLRDSMGRRLAEHVYATHPVPHFVKSGMDGFAVRAADIRGAKLQHPVLLEVNQVIPCGTMPDRPIASGQAARIMTGAPLPEGADTVVMFEMTEDREQNGQTYVAILTEVAHGRNVSTVGEEMEQGELLLERGRVIGAGEIALLATFGYDRVTVSRKPRVAVCTTGSELLPVEAPLEPGKIRNSNLWMLTALITSAGGEIAALESLPDDVGQAKQLLERLNQEADVLITSGGVSVGDYDIMADLFDQWDGQLLFNKVMMRPGSVTTAGVWKDKLLFALSGNPGACYVGYELFVRPALEGLQGQQERAPRVFTARLKGEYAKANIYARYLRAKTTIAEGVVYVEPAGKDQSSVTVSIKDTDCLIVIPPGGGAEDGDLVQAISVSRS